jgi:hypothetical protein
MAMVTCKIAQSNRPRTKEIRDRICPDIRNAGLGGTARQRIIHVSDAEKGKLDGKRMAGLSQKMQNACRWSVRYDV